MKYRKKTKICTRSCFYLFSFIEESLYIEEYLILPKKQKKHVKMKKEPKLTFTKKVVETILEVP